jgi:hypothetical protein
MYHECLMVVGSDTLILQVQVCCRHFFVDMSLVQGDLAFASPHVMDSERGLCFNICSLENSYLPNSSVPDLEKQVKESISTELSYSCHFWGTHVAGFSFKSSLAKEVEAFFNGECLLWWLEALALMKNLGGSVVTLSSITNWFSVHSSSLFFGHHILMSSGVAIGSC